MLNNSKNKGMKKIGLVTPIPWDVIDVDNIYPIPHELGVQLLLCFIYNNDSTYIRWVYILIFVKDIR